VTVKEALPVLLCESVAEQVTDMVPNAKVAPDVDVQVTGSKPSTASEALVMKLTAAPEGSVASAMISAGTVTAGGVVSWTVTVNKSASVIPPESVTVQFTVVRPKGNKLPERWSQLGAGSGLSSTSVAMTLNVTLAPAELVASAVIGPGTVRVGGVLAGLIAIS